MSVEQSAGNTETSQPVPYTRLVLINVAILIALLLVIELAARVVKFGASCIETCSYEHLANPHKIVSSRPQSMQMYVPHRTLGFIPRAGFSKTFDEDAPPEWRGKKVTLLEDGVRANDNDQTIVSATAPPVIIAGDSFTFGEEVSNNETWSACLERRLQRPIHNAGVSGYGGAQSLKRLQMLSSERNTAAVVLSVLVGGDFDRDQHTFVYGRPIPSVTGASLENLRHESPPDASIFGSIFDPYPPTWLGEVTLLLANNSWLVRRAALRSEFFQNYIRERSERHKSAAPKDLIIEWTLKSLSEMDRPSLIVLQYWKGAGQNVAAERKLILRLAKKYGVDVVDTYEIRNNGSVTLDELFEFYHHSARGNRIVCEAIAPRLKDLLRQASAH